MSISPPARISTNKAIAAKTIKPTISFHMVFLQKSESGYTKKPLQQRGGKGSQSATAAGCCGSNGSISRWRRCQRPWFP
jgi:hypothetical protein